MKHSTSHYRRFSRFVSLLLVVGILLIPITPVLAQDDAALPADSVTVEVALPESPPAAPEPQTVAPQPEPEAAAQAPSPSLPAPEASASESQPPAAEQVSAPAPASDASAQDENLDEGDDEEDVQLDLGDDSVEADALKNFSGVVRQSKPYTCGPAALATLRTQLGDDTSEQDVLQYISDLSEEKGVSLLSLKNAAQQLGSTVVLKTWSAEQVLEYVKQTQDPVLIHDEKKDVGGHFSVIREYDVENQKVELSDTEAGNIKYSVEDFSHIYTGSALVIYSGDPSEFLADSATDLSDEKAADIWGKYVPVYMLAEKTSDREAQADAAMFRRCIAAAMNIQNKTTRNNARAQCYDALGRRLTNDLSTLQEAALAAKYQTQDRIFSKDIEETAVGTAEILNTLNRILRYQKGYASTLSYLTTVQRKTGGYAVSDLPVLNTRLATAKARYDQARVNKNLLDTALNSKQSTADKLQANINSGSFSSGGQSFKLGAVGSQVSAQAAAYQRLSAGLASKLASLDGQITNKQNQLNSLTRQKQTSDAKLQSIRNEYNSLTNLLAYYKRIRYYSSYEVYRQTNLLYSLSLQQMASDSLQNQINSATQDLQRLRDQKTSAKSEVDSSAAEKARLERLKSFGEQELQRNRDTLSVLRNDIANLQRQLVSVNASVQSYGPQVSTLQDQIDALNNVAATNSDLNDYHQSIFALANRYGYTTITDTNTRETERLIDEELAFEKSQDDKALVLATQGADKALAPVAVPVGFIAGVLKGAYSVIEGGVTLVFHPVKSFDGMVFALQHIDLVAKQAFDGLKGRGSAILYVDGNSFVSVYNASDALGHTAFDACLVVCTLGVGAEVKGVQVEKIAIDVMNAEKEAAEIAKLSRVLKAEQLNALVSALIGLKDQSTVVRVLTELGVNADVATAAFSRLYSITSVESYLAELDKLKDINEIYQAASSIAARGSKAVASGEAILGGGGNIIPMVDAARAPEYVRDVLRFENKNKWGTSMPNYKGGSVFENNKLSLPQKGQGYYTEWDVLPKESGVDRGAQRLIRGQNGEVYYTVTHYEDNPGIQFIKLQ